VIELPLGVAAHRGDGELGKAEAQVDVGARVVDEPAVAIAIWRVVEPDSAAHERAVIRWVRRQARAVEPEAAAAPLRARVSGNQDQRGRE